MKKVLAAAILTAGLVGQASASVVWNLNNFTFDDGTAAQGSFTWDESNNTATAWNIVTVDGTHPGVHYSNSTGSSFTIDYLGGLLFTEPRGGWAREDFRLGFANLDLLDTPSAALALSSQSTGLFGANGFLECDNCGVFRTGREGAYVSAITSSVPESQSIILLALGLCGLVSRKLFRKV